MKKNTFRTLLLVVTGLTGWIITWPMATWAAMGVCANCHVMHASQQGATTPASGPQDFLMRDTCVGCHTGTNSTNGSAPAIPFVYTAAAADLSTSLAGGNFKFSDLGDDRYGHNPKELSGGVDATLSSPPGWKSGFNANGQVGTIVNTVEATKLSCAGTYGCHGTHDANGVNGSHHANATGALTTANTVANSYRFLYGIKGYEAVDYEYQPAATDGDHNVYLGKARSGAEATADVVTAGTDTISYLCAECHGIFHSGSASNEGISDTGDTFFTNPWIRHPVDVDMPLTGEFAGYNAYVPGVPVASTSVADSTITVGNANDRIVMCLSCHRAHASPYNAALRWNPADVNAGNGASTTGCFACHTTKDT
jgi:hypothetical protein